MNSTNITHTSALRDVTSLQTANILAENGIHTVADIIAMTDEQLLAIKGIKEKRLAAIHEDLANAGFAFGDAVVASDEPEDIEPATDVQTDEPVSAVVVDDESTTGIQAEEPDSDAALDEAIAPAVEPAPEVIPEDAQVSDDPVIADDGEAGSVEPVTEEDTTELCNTAPEPYNEFRDSPLYAFFSAVGRLFKKAG